MKKTIPVPSKMTLLAGLVSLAMCLPARAADYTVIHLETMVDRPADQVWSRVGDYCAIKDWLGVTCVITAGSGDVGTIRHLNVNGATDEIMVAKTRYSYAYTQPATTILYHGSLEVEPLEAGRSRLVYTLLYDQAPLLTAEAQAADRARRSARFTAALAKMKAIAEAP